MVADSASLQRAFSMFKLIKTDRRNRLAVNKMNDLALVNLDIKLPYQNDADASKKRKRT